ncbi:MAG TPA: hypothetical protein P5160_07780, partial [Candidatus Omnitrophota bacterium]|nr:hypothetical protein [Candidatus Omnitrophota bacterium]
DNGTALHFAPEGAYASWNSCGKYLCCTVPQWKGICGAPGSPYEGYGLYDRYCGGSEFVNWQPFWINDPANCVNNCSASIDLDFAQWCDPVNYNIGLPSANLLVKYIDNCSQAAVLGVPYSENKCLARCLGTPLLTAPDHSNCRCPHGYTFNPTATGCPTGYTQYNTWAEVQTAICGSVGCCNTF